MDACMKYKKNSRQEAELIPELDKIKGINRDAVMKAKATLEWNSKAITWSWAYGRNNNTDSRNPEYSECTYRQKGCYCNVCRQRNS